MEPPELMADGLVLRGWRPDDIPDVHRACQDPDIQRWTSVPSPYRPEHAAGFVTGIAPKAWEDATGAPFAVSERATGELLGSCGLVSIDRSGRWAEIGYWTAPWARGRGVAVRATRAVARWAFEMLGVRRIVWQAEVGNHASRLVALRAGCAVDGRLRLAEPHAAGTSDGWVGSLLPADLVSRADPLIGDVGFLVAPWARGRGYAPAALVALCEWGFKALGLARIEWRARVGNEASWRAAEKAGFAYEGTARAALNFRGQRVDAWVGALVPGGTG
jgi:RimJ/RimL family protein N-acetyltransferase